MILVCVEEEHEEIGCLKSHHIYIFFNYIYFNNRTGSIVLGNARGGGGGLQTPSWAATERRLNNVFGDLVYGR